VLDGSDETVLADHLGTIRDVVGSDRGLLNHVVYDTFGNVLGQTDADEQPRFAFAGRELDAESGLYYNRLRYYDPAAGRFISEDPIGFAGGDGNLYRYVGNSPLNFTDPLGLSDTAGSGSGLWGKAVSVYRQALGVYAMVPLVGNPFQATKQAWDMAADINADMNRGVGFFDAAADAYGRHMPFINLGYLAGETWKSDTITSGVEFGRTICLREKIERNVMFFGSEALALAGAGAIGARGLGWGRGSGAGTQAPESLIGRNAAQGAEWEHTVGAQLERTQTNVVDQITVKTESGVRTRLDFVGNDSSTGATALTEAKSSATAPLTPKQAAAFPEIEQSGAAVVGAGKPPFVGGTVIPPTPVKVVRP